LVERYRFTAVLPLHIDVLGLLWRIEFVQHRSEGYWGCETTCPLRKVIAIAGTAADLADDLSFGIPVLIGSLVRFVFKCLRDAGLAELLGPEPRYESENGRRLKRVRELQLEYLLGGCAHRVYCQAGDESKDQSAVGKRMHFLGRAIDV